MCQVFLPNLPAPDRDANGKKSLRFLFCFFLSWVAQVVCSFRVVGGASSSILFASSLLLLFYKLIRDRLPTSPIGPTDAFPHHRHQVGPASRAESTAT